jgi:lipoprotein signal peptidase
MLPQKYAFQNTSHYLHTYIQLHVSALNVIRLHHMFSVKTSTKCSSDQWESNITFIYNTSYCIQVGLSSNHGTSLLYMLASTVVCAITVFMRKDETAHNAYSTVSSCNR